MSAQNPACAALMSHTYRFLLGWDMVQQRPYKGGGILGYVRTFARTDQQSRLTLHGHLVVFLNGHNNLYEKLQQLVERFTIFRFGILHFYSMACTEPEAACLKCSGPLTPTKKYVEARRVHGICPPDLQFYNVKNATVSSEPNQWLSLCSSKLCIIRDVVMSTYQV